MLNTGRICVDPLLTDRMPFDRAARAYAALQERKDEHMGIILQYSAKG
jgi:threonine dehydrogenase-like Zn-dependent dehydrogenase